MTSPRWAQSECTRLKMITPFPLVLCAGAIEILLSLALQNAFGQTPNPSIRIFNTNENVAVAWTGRGTLQSAVSPLGSWRDALEAPNPSTLSPSNAHEFFRVISRWGTRSNLLEANSEMAVAELDGKIYIMG